MAYDLNIEWRGDIDSVEAPEARLFAYDQATPGNPVQGQYQSGRFSFTGLEPEAYLLSLRYAFKGKHYDSYYFLLDIPDITLIRLELKPEGAQIDQMGFVDDSQELVDMLIYQDEKPWLTRPVEELPFLQTLAEFLVFRFAHLPVTEARQQLSRLLGDLSGVFSKLEHLWPYQVKMLIQPQYLAQTSAEWKASLLHLLRNNLILMDNESLYEILSEATALAQQEDRVDKLSAELEWDSETLSWHNLEAFLADLKGKQMALN